MGDLSIDFFIMSAADEAAALSRAHQTWMVELLQEKNGSVSYEELVEVGEEKHCDTVGAMLKILKKRGVLTWEGTPFLMYPMHKDHIITLVDADKL